jgi:hypothetical protein
MTEQAEREMAWLLAEGSDVFDFDTALEIVRQMPDKAEEILRIRASQKRYAEESARLRERRRLALIEDYG